MRIRKRLSLYGAFVIGIAMFVFALLLNLLATQGAPRDQEDSLSELAGVTGDSLAEATSVPPPNASPLFPADLATSLDPFVAVYREDGAALYTTGLVDGAAPRLPAAVVVEAMETGASTARIHPAPGIELRVVALGTTLADGTPVVVVAGQSTDFVEQQLIGLRVVIWVAAIITLIAAAVASWIVSGRALRPLRDLVSTTDEIRETGDLSRRLARVKADDEVGRLADSFNSMLETVQSAQARLTDALTSQRRFVADASHELRGPLTTIRANAGFLRDRHDVTDADRTEAVADISTQADRMSRLVDDLLILAGADAGVPVARATVDLGTVVADVGRTMQRLGRPLLIEGSGRAMVRGDRDALTRLVWILADNAERHGAGDITATLDGGDGSVQLRVIDQGRGFRDSEIDRVFERFYRADPARSPEGSGLGLAIAHEIVAAHEGTITAANHRDGGAELTVTFPAA